jgi:hypothetical protein
VTLIVLKLTGVATWPWWWILAPLWIQLGLVLLVLTAWVLALRHWWKSRPSPFRDLLWHDTGSRGREE